MNWQDFTQFLAGRAKQEPEQLSHAQFRDLIQETDLGRVSPRIRVTDKFYSRGWEHKPEKDESTTYSMKPGPAFLHDFLKAEIDTHRLVTSGITHIAYNGMGGGVTDFHHVLIQQRINYPRPRTRDINFSFHVNKPESSADSYCSAPRL